MNPSDSNGGQSSKKKRSAEEMVIHDDEEDTFKKAIYMKEAFVTHVTDSNQCTFIHLGREFDEFEF
jgi:hypothetical protein